MVTDALYRSLRAFPALQRQAKRVVLRLPHRRRLVRHFGQRLWVDPSELHGFYLYYERAYDDYIFQFLSGEMAKYGRVLDVGANVGIYTVFFAARARHVDAFEPEASVLGRLKENVALNGLRNVDIHAVCVGQNSGAVRFAPPTLHNQGLGQITLEGALQLPCTCLDDFLRGSAEEPLLIKMDIEGGEWLAVQGGLQQLSQRAAPVAILMELHPVQIAALGGTVPGLRSMLEGLGMKVRALTPDGAVPTSTGDNHRFWWIIRETA